VSECEAPDCSSRARPPRCHRRACARSSPRRRGLARGCRRRSRHQDAQFDSSLRRRSGTHGAM
jgi:hypothetical protein